MALHGLEQETLPVQGLPLLWCSSSVFCSQKLPSGAQRKLAVPVMWKVVVGGKSCLESGKPGKQPVQRCTSSGNLSKMYFSLPVQEAGGAGLLPLLSEACRGFQDLSAARCAMTIGTPPLQGTHRALVLYPWEGRQEAPLSLVVARWVSKPREHFDCVYCTIRSRRHQKS